MDLKYTKKKKYGGFCMNKPCNKIEVKIDPSNVINKVIKGILYPINFLIKSILLSIKFLIEYWNDLIIKLSYVFQDFVFNLIFSINGYIDVFNMIASELKVLLQISLNILTNNPIVLITLYTTPIVLELRDFILDSVTFEMFSNLFYFNFIPIKQFFVALSALLMGKTIKPICNKNLYGTNSQKHTNCHAYNVPKCRLNLSTVFNITYYIIIIFYIAGWMSFLKIFYSDIYNNNMVEFILNKNK